MSQGQAPASYPPSEVAPPTKVNEVPQQASTSPGDGSEVTETGAPETSFKDQVLGYAKLTRGTVLGKSETKEEGQKILDGEPGLQKYPVDQHQ